MTVIANGEVRSHCPCDNHNRSDFKNFRATRNVASLQQEQSDEKGKVSITTSASQ